MLIEPRVVLALVGLVPLIPAERDFVIVPVSERLAPSILAPTVSCRNPKVPSLQPELRPRPYKHLMSAIPLFQGARSFQISKNRSRHQLRCHLQLALQHSIMPPRSISHRAPLSPLNTPLSALNVARRVQAPACDALRAAAAGAARLAALCRGTAVREEVVVLVDPGLAFLAPGVLVVAHGFWRLEVIRSSLGGCCSPCKAAWLIGWWVVVGGLG